MVGSTYFVYGTLIFIYIFCSKALAVHYTFVISTFFWFLVEMKMFIRFPRPYQGHDDVLPTECTAQYGCPSATAIRVSTIIFSLYLDFIHEKRRRLGPSLFYFWTFLTTLIIVLVAVSRVYLAAHSINQVIFGSGVGIASACFLHFSVKRALYRHLRMLSGVSPSRMNYKSCIFKAVIVFAISQLIPLITYYYVINHSHVPQQYIDNLKRKCPPYILDKAFDDRAFPYIGKPALGFGAYLGVLFQHRFLTSNTNNQTEMWKSFIRLGISLLVVWVFVKQLELVKWTTDSLLLLYLNKTVVPCFGAAFLLCAIFDCIFEYMGLLNRDYPKSGVSFNKQYCVYFHGDMSFEKDDPRLESLLPNNNSKTHHNP